MKEIPANETSLPKHGFVYYTDDVDQGFLKWVILAAFSLYKPAPVQTASCSLGVSMARKDLMLSLFHESVLWMPLPWALWAPHCFCRVPGCSWAVPDLVCWGACAISGLSCSPVALGRGCCLPGMDLSHLSCCWEWGIHTGLLSPLFLTWGEEAKLPS